MFNKISGDVNETPADRAERYYANRPKLTRNKHCPHCHAVAPRAVCKTCGREMCDDCISHDPSVGPVCGLCYDRKNNPEPDDDSPF